MFIHRMNQATDSTGSLASKLPRSRAGMKDLAMRESMCGIQTAEHRLEFVISILGVDYVNDSKATNINATWFALEMMHKPVVLIMGGVDKGNNYDVILEMVKKKVRGIIMLGKNNEKVVNYFKREMYSILTCESMSKAVYLAYYFARKGDVVLLSPACASFDLFEDYEDRGQQFKKYVRLL